jgi:flagellar basal-body rod protein FlgG
MLEGLHAAAAGMAAQQARMDALAEDVANVSTTGYKHQRVAFRELVYVPAGPAAARRVATGAGAATELAGRGLAQGPLQQTGRSLDVAIEGSGFLQVRRPDGSVGLTRAGALQVDATGRLTTATGAPLDPPIRVPPGTADADVAIAADGTVTAAGRRVGKIGVVDVAAPEQLAAAGDTTFVPTAGSGPVRPATGSELAQGTLEASNVEVSDTMVDMIDAQRAYALASRAVQIQDQMLDVANGVKR